MYHTIVTLKKGEGRTIKSGGAWIYDNEIDTITGRFHNGDMVTVHDFDGYPMGNGFINQNSKIRIRMMTRKSDQEVDEAFLRMRVQNAWDYRKTTVDTSSCRVIFGEADFLPGLVIDAIENRRGTYLAAWAKEIVEKKISTVNMLGCHDGIPLLDLKGLLPKEEIQSLIDRIVSRGGMVKNLHGQKNLYYQVNATYYSALGESDEKMLLARAIQMFMPGKPQIWYLDLFAGKNDHEAVQRAGESGHKEINRTNLSVDQIAEGLKKDVVQKQLALIRMRNTHKAFSEGAEVTISGEESSLEIRWEYDGAYAELYVNFEEGTYTIESN